MKIPDIIRNQDLFGHGIKLNFDKTTIHKTLIGGAFSILLKIIVFAYIMLKLSQLLVIGDPRHNTLVTTIKLEE